MSKSYVIARHKRETNVDGKKLEIRIEDVDQIVLSSDCRVVEVKKSGNHNDHVIRTFICLDDYETVEHFVE